MGVRSTNISNKVPLADELVANREGSTGVISVKDLSTQLAGSGPLSDLVHAATTGLVRAATLAGLVAGTRVGQPGQVTAGSEKGEYAWSGSAWIKVSDLLQLTAEQQTGLMTLLGNLLGINGLVDPATGRFSFKSSLGFAGFRYDPVRGFGVPGAWFRQNRVGGVRVLDRLGFAVRLVGSDGSAASKTTVAQGSASTVNIAPADSFIIAHRGFARLGPENTIAAWSEAARLKADAAECDIHLTSDGVPVVMHDDTVDRTTNGTGAVASLTLAQIKALDAGGNFHPKFAGARVPTFQEFLDYCKGRFAWIYPEIKTGAGNVEVSTIVNMIAASGWTDRCVLTSFDPAVLLYARTIAPTLVLGFTGSFNYISQASANKPAILCINKDDIYASPGQVANAKGQGVDVAGWTVRSSNDRRKLNAIGVTRIFCDIPV